jgi:hypothetical protein
MDTKARYPQLADSVDRRKRSRGEYGRDDQTSQFTIAAEFLVWADTNEQARAKLQHALNRLEFDSEMEAAK